MAMLGAGDTARAAVPVMAKAFALKEIRVTSRTPESRESYAKEIGKEYGLNVRAVESTEAALRRRRFGRLGDDHLDAVREG